MSTSILAFSIELSSVCCCKCGMHFAIPATVERERRRDKQNFYCPAGHSQYFPGETEEQRLRREVEVEKRRRVAEWERANAQAARAEKAERKLRRVKKGVCPECNRTFQDLARHMKCKHKA